MNVYYETRQLKRLCDESSEAQRVLGAQSARKLRMRLGELVAARDLSEISHRPPQRLHQLKGSRAARFAVSLHGGHRLVFGVADLDEAAGSSGEIVKTAVRSIVVTFVGDYHDE